MKLSDFKPKAIQGLYHYAHYEGPNGSWIQTRLGAELHVVYRDPDGKMTEFNSIEELKASFGEDAVDPRPDAPKAAAPKKYWLGDEPKKCDICQKLLHGSFVDGKTKFGPWGIMHPSCHRVHGAGLGAGRGQKYEWQVDDGRWLKVEG